MSTTGYSYCAQHDMYFVDHQDRDQHIQSSSDHAQCDLCDRRFLNKNTLRNHWVYAEHHYYCWECDKHFKSAPGLQYHLDEVHIGDDDDDSDEECSCYQSDESDNWEDDRGAERYPDGIPSETLAHKKGVNDDNSWEDLDDLDFEDEEDLVDPPTQWGDESSSSSDEDSDEENEGSFTRDFTCPMCDKSHGVICTTQCGHLFCAPCITGSYKFMRACPICDEPGEVSELRRVYVSTQ